MIVIVADMVAVPGREADLLAAVQDVLEPSRAEAGCIRYLCGRDLENPAQLLMFEEWADGAAIRTHTATEHYARFRTATEGVIGEQHVTVHKVERTPTP